MAVEEGGSLSDAKRVEDPTVKHCRQIRRASESEKTLACFLRHVDIDNVADAWIDEDGTVDLVLHGFTDRVMVPLNLKEIA